MQYTTRGIVIHHLRYADTSLIVKVLTEEYGLRSYIFRSVYKSRSRFPAATFQHLNHIELIADDRDYGGLHHPRSARIETPYLQLHTNIVKSSVCLFLNEVLFRVLKHEEANKDLYFFLRESLLSFDQWENSPPEFHLWFMVHLTRYLGCSPQQPASGEWCFNLKEGVFEEVQRPAEHHMQKGITACLIRLMNTPLAAIHTLHLPRNERESILYNLLYYYRFHMEDFGEMRSPAILSEVFS